jgi:hypothetical protein
MNPSDDRLACSRRPSIAATRCDMCTPRLSAISVSAFQNSSSRLTLVFLPLKTIERLSIVVEHEEPMAIDDSGMGLTVAASRPSPASAPPHHPGHPPARKTNHALRGRPDAE